MDSDGVMNADHVYENVNSKGVYNTKFVYFSDDCLDSSFLFNCVGCSNCFGCVNLRNQKYYIFNVPYSKEEYFEKIKYWDLGSYKIIKEAQEKFMEVYYKTPRRFTFSTNCTNVLGDDMENTKNCQYCFDTRHGVENCKYIYLSGLLLKDSYDVALGGDTSELLYEVSSSTQSQNTFFTSSANNSTNVQYSENIYNGSYLFGCTKMRHKKYCILNKKYSKEEYFVMVKKIKKHMNDMPYIDKIGHIYRYGEFFPPEHSFLAYNESLAHQWFPLTQEQALKKGYIWREHPERNYKITMNPHDVSNHINDVPDSILDEVIGCKHSVDKDGVVYDNPCNEQCTTAFKITHDELQFYRNMNIAVPHLCSNCRYYGRLKKRNPQKLWHRSCMCGGQNSQNGEYKNTVNHFHSTEPCTLEFETAISNDRMEIVYCEKCYQSEFVL